MPVQRRRRQTGPFANARRCWRTSGRATPSLRCASSGTFSSDCCTIPTPDSRTPRGSLLDAKGGHDWKRFDTQFLGEGKGARDIRHPSVKRRIEAGNLWQLRKMLLREANDRQRRRIVQRREGGCCFELTQHGVVDQAMATKIRPTVHYAMPDRDRLGLSTVREKPPDARDRVPMGSEICRFGSQRIVISVSRPELASRPPIDSASPREASSGWKIRPGKVRT